MARFVRYQLDEKNEAVLLSHKVSVGDANNFAVGLNWIINSTFDGRRKISLSGNTFAFSSYIVLYPDQDFGMILMTNESDMETQNELGDIAQSVFEENYYTAAQRSSDGFGFSKAINKLLKELTKKGFDHTIDAAADLQTGDPAFKLGENEVNAWAYFLLGKGEKEKALEIFKLNVSLYPESANTYDSLGEIYALLGKKEPAIKNYKRSLELNPKNENAVEQLKKLEQ